MMKLKHIAFYDIVEWEQILQEVNTLSHFIKNVAKYGKQQDPDIYKPTKYMGDCWEVFAEFFFKFFNGDHILTYTADYEPNLGIDRGIDGKGKSTLDGNPNVIQIKYKSNPTSWLTNDDNISNIAADAMVNEGVQYNGKNVIIFTSCKGIHPKHAMANVHCITNKDIARRVDYNVIFWEKFREQNGKKELT